MRSLPHNELIYFIKVERPEYPEVGRVAKNCTQVIVALPQHSFTQVKVKSSRPRNYSSKSKKVFSENGYLSTE